ncbi:sensor histidine kinase [Microbacterium sp. NPDC012755]|uniref:sensor histidine kinase n=1 Tax=Microbacterium sp. NPDC012755 TaxID=3364184 RepID=UPI00369ED651
MNDLPRPVWRSRAWGAALIVLVVLVVLVAAVGVDGPRTAGLVAAATALAASAVVVWAMRRTRRQRREFEVSLTAWAAERATQEERLRIARELHDLASHGLGVITVRAAAAQTAGVADAERMQALSDIEEAGRSATAELRRMLSVLRSPEPASRRPTPDLGALVPLIAEAERSDLSVRLDRGELGDVPAGVQAAAVAIIGEALANSIRHAGPTATDVRLRRRGDAVEVEVEDAGSAPGWQAHPGAGHGVIGMRERAASLGGSVSVGATETGFLVTAVLPCGDAG